MFKFAAEQHIKEFASDNENWKPNTNMMDSAKLQLLSVVEENPGDCFIERILHRHSYFVHDTTFRDLVKGRRNSAVEREMEPKETVVGEFDTIKNLKLSGSIKAEMKKIFQMSMEGVASVTINNDFGKIHEHHLREQQLINYFNSHLFDLEHPLLKQLLERKETTIGVVSGIATIKGDSTLSYETNHDVELQAKYHSISGSAEHIGNQSKEISVPDGTVLMYRVTKVHVSKVNGKVSVVLSEE